MAFTLSKSAAFGVSAKARSSTRRSVRVQAAAVPENVASARAWISEWKGKQAGSFRDAALPSWMPGASLPGYLDGTLPGDFGFDPLALGAEPSKLKWYAQGELMNARFAMLAVAGILIPELLSSIGLSWPGAGVAWYDAGKFEYFAPASALFGVQMLLFSWAEFRRYQDILKPGSANVDPIFTNNKLPDGNEPGYPGGIFDPFGWSKGDMKALKTKEIKNGRLAMLAFAGFVGQAYTTGTTPLKNLATHLADPWSTTVWQNDLARL
ncbi:Chlorophyll a-b binding protein, chloroplastic [Tetrabaena socialis]|uniref:Chlorophyll a-b binding protein, chloroplastic n=1 Tax=Tetrabaena socialis TaxID=47790 RepID=A0A2J7ZK40_9CHLO|nr:Chlorophyll a-b binding protein, chloroplastic [Tetrabaena socialis]|eukprot:PNH00627.1 Chlorophyll a-b binding protein, chloroplastic [Tetrabaena socialis]